MRVYCSAHLAFLQCAALNAMSEVSDLSRIGALVLHLSKGLARPRMVSDRRVWLIVCVGCIPALDVCRLGGGYYVLLSTA